MTNKDNFNFLPRVENLEIQAEKIRYRKVDFSVYSQPNSTFAVAFFADKQGVVRFEFDFLPHGASCLLDGVSLLTYESGLGARATATLDVGEHTLCFGGGGVNGKVCVEGYVRESESGQSVSVLNLQGKSVIAQSYQNVVSVFEYDGNSLELKFQTQGKSAVVCNFYSAVALAVLGVDASFKLLVFGRDYSVRLSATLDAQISKVATEKSSGAVFYAIKANRLYRYEVASDLSVNKTRLGGAFSNVYASPNVENCFAVVDFNQNAKVELGGLKRKLPRAQNFHFANDGGRLSVLYGNGGLCFRQTLLPAMQTCASVAFASEADVLFNGKMLFREQNNLFIKGE